MGNEQGKALDTTTPDGVRAMDESLQRKFSKGIQYNMKIVIRGDRNTGKTCLWYRMQGKNFTDNYIPTNEIQVAHIHWNYPGTHDTAKVEIWDVVDKGKVQKSTKGLKLFNTGDSQKDSSELALDAEFMDVYKGAHAAVFIYDIVKKWTWEYIERQINNVPLHIPILVLGNFSDMSDHRNNSYEDAEFYVTHLNRPEGAADIRYAECSMKNGFGLRFLHKFLSIPFLQMQQESLLHQLKVNREQILAIQEELDGYQTSVSYVEFQEKMTTPKIPQQPEKKPSSTPSQAPPTEPNPSPIVDTSRPYESTDGLTPESTNKVSVTRKLSSKFSGFLSRNKEPRKQSQHQDTPKSLTPKSPGGRKQNVKNVDEFVPEGELDDQFFNDDEAGDEGAESREDGEESKSDEDYNPQVAIDEDLSSGEEEITAKEKSVEEEQEDEEEEEDDDEEDDEEESDGEVETKGVKDVEPAILQPTKVNSNIVSPPSVKEKELRQIEVKKSKPQPLKSVHDIVLTDSEDEEGEGPVVKGDDDISEEEIQLVKPKSVNQAEKHKDSRKTSGGLLLAFNETPPSKTKTKKKKSEKVISEIPTSSEKRKKDHRSSRGEDSSRHKKHKKKNKQEKVEDESTETKEKKEDPFGFSTSLDAWLAAGDESPAQSRSTHGLSKKLTESIEEEEEEKPRKKKKHKEEGGHGERRRTKKGKKDGGAFNELL